MPFKSKEQERYLQINEPEIYRDWVEKYGRFKGAESFGAEGGYSHQVFNTTSKAHAEKVASLVPDSIVIVNLHGIPDDSSHYFVMSKTSYDEARPYFMGWLRENDYFRTNQFLSEVKYDAESFNAENEKRSKYMNEKRSKYMDYIYDMFYTPDSDAYKLREIRYPKLKGQEHQIASQVRNAFDKRQSPFDSVLHNNLKGLSMTRQPFYYHIPYKGKLFVFSYIVKGRGRLKQGYHTYYPPDSQFGEEQICGLETKHGDECYCWQKNYKSESFGADSSVYVESKDYSNEIVEKLNPILRNKIGKTFILMNTDDDSWMFRLTDVDENLDDDFIEYGWEKEVYAPHKNNHRYVGFDWKEQGFNCFHSHRPIRSDALYGFNIPLANAGYEMKRMDKIDPSEYKLVKIENLDAESFSAENYYGRNYRGFEINKEGDERQAFYYLTQGDNRIEIEFTKSVEGRRKRGDNYNYASYFYGNYPHTAEKMFETFDEALNWFDEQIDNGRMFKDFKAESFEANEGNYKLGNYADYEILELDTHSYLMSVGHSESEAEDLIERYEAFIEVGFENGDSPYEIGISITENERLDNEAESFNAEGWHTTRIQNLIDNLYNDREIALNKLLKIKNAKLQKLLSSNKLLKDRVGGLSLAQWAEVQAQLKYTPSGRIRTFGAESFGAEEWWEEYRDELEAVDKSSLDDFEIIIWNDDIVKKHGKAKMMQLIINTIEHSTKLSPQLAKIARKQEEDMGEWGEGMGYDPDAKIGSPYYAESFGAEAIPIRHSRRLNGYYGIKGYDEASEDGFTYRIYRSPGTNDWFRAMVYDDNSLRDNFTKPTSRRLNPSGEMVISNDPASLLIGAFPKLEDAKRALVFRMIQDGNYHQMMTDGNLKWLLKDYYAESFGAEECVSCDTPDGYWRGLPLCSSSGEELCISCCSCNMCRSKWNILEVGEQKAESFNSYKIAPDLSSYTKAELVSSIAGPQGTAAYDEVVYDPLAQSRLSAESIDSFSPARLVVLGASIGVALGLYNTRRD